jgi:hypothetical protein
VVIITGTGADFSRSRVNRSHFEALEFLEALVFNIAEDQGDDR